MPERDPQDFRPRATSSGTSHSGIAAAVLVAAAAAGAAWWYWWRPAPVPEAAPVVAQAPTPPAEPAPAPEVSEPQHPIDALEPPSPALPALQDSDAHVAQALDGLLGRDKVGRFLQTDGFVRRAVATVDNLTRSQAPARLWPVHPSPQRFQVEGAEDAQTIAPANAARYQAFVAFAEAVPLDAAASLYVRLYPLFQAAYEDLGYPRRYFNDRLIDVIDHLRAAPEPADPLQVRLTRVEGEVPSVQPWVRYEYADPGLQSLSSGQKMLVRVGLDNERRLKAVLGEFRRRIATGEMDKSAR
ncbi:Protein of uncharacterised function (DUF3014) [Delftia tsuruhatensis]|uniref:DUF3014 domain-containing protein n=1 Tax=Delftia tsuruhatensis TaxID=180282 RepID=UPI001E7857A8|nr:DUF3014 domain-containing protein [Delftia tsuruhatensis]CAB5721331.1 Protein of uncharacterised function (DUF3014) [Delftia tsuruhatensis]CAC9688361.1 Protein of uncharacterised function (DUF3014) [Delftia tsuruhatensis]